MCVIAYAEKNKFKDSWFASCCSHNPDGFLVTDVNTGDYIRTLDYKKAFNFFSKIDASHNVLLHARIASVGMVNLSNVHGWVESGIQFCHNGTLNLTADPGKTDSETIFRSVVVPLYLQLGDTPAFDKAVKCICPSNSRFAIVVNNRVILAGTYSTVEEEDHDGKIEASILCSNTYWKPYKNVYLKADDKWDDDYGYGRYKRAKTGYDTSNKKQRSTGVNTNLFGEDDYDDDYVNFWKSPYVKPKKGKK